MDYKSDSRQRTPWTGKGLAMPVQHFIDSCNAANYNRNHPSVKDSIEHELLDNYPIRACRYCSSKGILSYGRTAAGAK